MEAPEGRLHPFGWLGSLLCFGPCRQSKAAASLMGQDVVVPPSLRLSSVLASLPFFRPVLVVTKSC